MSTQGIGILNSIAGIPIYGCTNSLYIEYDPNATVDDGSCSNIGQQGCTDANYVEYNATANIDDGSCATLIVSGCTDVTSPNYDSTANVDDGSCIAAVNGCTDSTATNYSVSANVDDGSCIYAGCTTASADNYNASFTLDDGSCVWSGCTNPLATNYTGFPSEAVIYNNYYGTAIQDDGSCLGGGCVDVTATNYDPNATFDDGSCIGNVTGDITGLTHSVGFPQHVGMAFTGFGESNHSVDWTFNLAPGSTINPDDFEIQVMPVSGNNVQGQFNQTPNTSYTSIIPYVTNIPFGANVNHTFTYYYSHVGSGGWYHYRVRYRKNINGVIFNGPFVDHWTFSF